MKTALLITLSLLLALMCACGGSGSNNASSTITTQPPANPPSATALQISPTSSSIAIGATQQFTATEKFSDGSSKNITSSAQWSSTDSSVASVSTAGLATASASGSVTITAQSGNFKAQATLTVTAATSSLTSITISPAAFSMPVHTSQQFTATGNYNDGSSADLTNQVSWSSSSTATATVNAAGLVNSLAAGTTTISAGFGGLSQSTTLTVTAPTIASVSVTPVGLTLGIGINQQFVATATYTDGTSSDLSSAVTWTSSDPSVATVDNTGLVATLAAGSTDITATVGSFSDTSTLTVVPAHLLSITVSPDAQSIALGTTFQFSAVGNFDDGSTQLLTSVSWSAPATSVATVDNSGLATGVGTGTTTITATSGSVSGSASLTVTAASLVSIAVTPANSTTAVGTTRQFTATGTFSDSSTQDLSKSVLWTSSNPAAATINSTGAVTSLAAGSTNIKAAFGTVSGSTTLTVSTAHLVSITISPANPRISKHTLVKFTATGTFSDGSTATNLAGVTWKSSKPSVASLRSSGIAFGKKGGSVTITASASGVKGTTTLTVGTGTLQSIAITPANVTATAGGTQQFNATGTFSDGTTQDVTLNAHWSSSSASVATIANAPSAAGLAQCGTAGSTTIGANSGGITGSTVLNVQ